jgi:hypothetical protein
MPTIDTQYPRSFRLLGQILDLSGGSIKSVSIHGLVEVSEPRATKWKKCHYTGYIYFLSYMIYMLSYVMGRLVHMHYLPCS